MEIEFPKREEGKHIRCTSLGPSTFKHQVICLQQYVVKVTIIRKPTSNRNPSPMVNKWRDILCQPAKGQK